MKSVSESVVFRFTRKRCPEQATVGADIYLFFPFFFPHSVSRTILEKVRERFRFVSVGLALWRTRSIVFKFSLSLDICRKYLYIYTV